MPFIAEVFEDTWTRITISQYHDGELRCAGCHSKMHVRRPTYWRDHFAHNPGHGSCPYFEGEYVNERPEHMSGKDYIQRFLIATHGINCQVAQEWIVDIDGQRRIIDVALFQDGRLIEAHEVQLATITLDEIKKRTDDYEKAGLIAHWYFGLEANTPRNIGYCQRRYIGGFEIEYAVDANPKTNNTTQTFDRETIDHGYIKKASLSY